MKVKIYDKTLITHYLSVLGIISSLVTIVSFFGTASDIGINLVYLAATFIVIIALIFVCMWLHANNKTSANLRIKGTDIKVLIGDILAPLNNSNNILQNEINIIGVNDYFDLIIDDRIIAKKSLHGQYINKIIESGKLEKLNNTIENDSLLNKSGNRKIVESRKIGRKVRYDLGSMVEFESFVLTAFTKFDSNNEAWLSAEEYTRFWMQFWANIDRIYAGRTINIPLMGAGITRFKNGKPSKQELLEVMLWSLKISGFHNTYADRQINFIIYPADSKEINFYHIQHNPSFK